MLKSLNSKSEVENNIQTASIFPLSFKHKVNFLKRDTLFFVKTRCATRTAKYYYLIRKMTYPNDNFSKKAMFTKIKHLFVNSHTFFKKLNQQPETFITYFHSCSTSLRTNSKKSFNKKIIIQQIKFVNSYN